MHNNLSDEERIELIKSNIGTFPDFPQSGTTCRDIFSALKSGEVCSALKHLLVNYIRKNHPDVEVIVAVGEKGFLFSLMLAAELGVACVPIRRKGKLPGKCFLYYYVIGFESNEYEIQKESIKRGQKVILVDDLLATGESLCAATTLLQITGGVLKECIVLMELTELNGRRRIRDTNMDSRDIFTALTSGEVCVALKHLLVNYVRKNHPDVEVIVGLDARGFLFSLMLAAELGVACVPIRKKGKLPGKCLSCSYALEYGTDEFEIQKDSIKPEQKVIVVDDLLATGGTLGAALKLLKITGAYVKECIVVMELTDLNGRGKLQETNVHSFIQY
ncbi:Adenine phosphoribosyltransferase [Pseudolycoriella hygida]|uniref:adenine phosphoribosyltransferase n=1 Tax=Pseudolycoriella hygida TaxID=35572 RepID=A0A9Q0MZH4_9DIPT|nr:Adenine phosphoribosyltransferase [Pseudolycoriella hygida]